MPQVVLNEYITATQPDGPFNQIASPVFTGSVDTGTMLAVYLFEGSGSLGNIQQVTDSQSNTYNDWNSGTNLQIAVALVENALQGGQATLNLYFGGTGGVEYTVIAVAFPEYGFAYGNIDQSNSPAGTFGAGVQYESITPSQVPVLLLAGAASAVSCDASTNPGWTTLATNDSDSANQCWASFQITTDLTAVDFFATLGGGGEIGILELSAPQLPIPNEQQLTGSPISLASNWEVAQSSYVAAFIHKNRTYLSGVLSTTVSDGSDVSLLLTITEQAFRPISTQPVVIQFEVSDPATPGISLPTQVDGFITADGELRMTTLPPYINELPTIGDGYYNVGIPANPLSPSQSDYFVNGSYEETNNLEYQVQLTSISWEIAPPPIGVQQVWQDLTPYLGPNWTNIDGEFSNVGAAQEFRGHVQAKVNGAGGYLYPIIGGTLPTLPTPNGYATTENYTFAQAPDFALLLQLYELNDSSMSGGEAFLIFGLDDTIYVAWVNGGYSSGYYNYSRVIGSNWPPNSVWTDAIVYTLPMDVTKRIPYDDGPVPAVFSNPLTNGDPVWQRNPDLDTGSLPLIAGLAIHAEYSYMYPGGARTYSNSWNDFASGFSGDLLPAGPGSMTMDLDISGQLSAYWPEPDYFALAWYWYINAAADGYFAPATWYELHAFLTSATGFQLLSLDLRTPMLPDWNSPGLGTQVLNQYGWVCPESPVEYPLDPYNPFTVGLWTPDMDIPTEFNFEIDWNTSGWSLYNDVNISWQISVAVIPFWNTRQNCVRAGDIIDLSTAILPINYSPITSPLLSTVVPGMPNPGLRTKGRPVLGGIGQSMTGVGG